MVILDTHVWLWWVGVPDELSARARSAIEGAASIGISPLSCWEVARLAVLRRITLDQPVDRWIQSALTKNGTRVLDLHPAAAITAARLGPKFPGDPIDRLLFATALELDAPLITKDRRLREAAPRRTLW